MNNEKYCHACNTVKKTSEYSIRKTKNGSYLNSYCKACMTKRMKKWREANREKFNKYQREYQRD